jgi:hypothetical protein
MPGQVFGVEPDPGQGVPAQVRDLPDDLETPDLFGPSRLPDGATSHLSDNSCCSAMFMALVRSNNAVRTAVT